MVCYGLTTGSISTWGELLGSAVALGIVSSIVCIPVLPFSSSMKNGRGRTMKVEQESNLNQPTQLEET